MKLPENKAASHQRHALSAQHPILGAAGPEHLHACLPRAADKTAPAISTTPSATPSPAPSSPASGAPAPPTLQDQQERLDAALAISQIGIWRLELDTGAISFDRQAAAMFGLAADAVSNGEQFLALIHTAERAAFAGSLARIRDGGGALDIEHRLHRGPGWLHSRARLRNTGAAAPAVLFGASVDISARKLAELALRDSAQHYKALIMACSHALYRMNADMSEMHVLEGKNMNIVADCDGRNWLQKLVHPDDRPQLALACAQALQNGSAIEFEHRVRVLGGGWGWVASRAVPLRDEAGVITEWLGMATDINDRKQTEENLWWRANFDVLTGLPNRSLFHDRLNYEIKKAQRSAQQLALLFIDLDRFKEVNDLLGHAVGDRLLVEASLRINACVRQSDTVARLGGDEFTAILTDLGELSHVENTAQKIIAALVEPFRLDDEEIYLSASVGITLYASDAKNADDLIRNADQAMYAAKNAGRNQFSYFTPGMQQQAHKRLRMISDLRNALHDGQLEVHFQPVVALASGAISKAEALLRWRHPRHGLIEPTVFIPYAEDSGLINDIGDWVFEQAALCAQRCSRRLGRAFQISVNRSPVQFRTRPTQLNWSAYLGRLGLPGSSITVEITEGVLLHASAAVTDSLLQYHDAGLEVAIDDFGTGYSSMAYLKKFPIDYLKIDQSFIHDMHRNSADRAIVKAMIVMAHELDLRVVAEGIETREQQRLLIDSGCDFGQGFLFSRAVPAREFESGLGLRH